MRLAMGLGGILFILVVLICLILFIVAIVKTARMWGALHIVLLCILFIQIWVFLIFTAGVQHERVRATKEAATQTERAKRVTAETNRLRFGSIDAPVDSLEAVVPVQARLERLTIDRGRVWRQLRFEGQQDNRIQLTLAAPSAKADATDGQPPAAAPATSGASLPANLVVYGFAEELDSEGQPLPVYYLGEYRVVDSAATGGRITIESTLPIHPLHQARIAQGLDGWTLYELLPIDSHVAFAAPGSEPSDEAIFGRMDEEAIQQLLAGVPESVMSAYLRDGQRASEDDRPEMIWEQVSLLKDHQETVDSGQNADATISGYFDPQGLSVDLRLKRHGQVELSPSDVRDNRIVVIESAARDWISKGIAERVQRLFVRPLNDYLGLFNRKYATAFELQERVKYYQYQNQLMEQATQTAQEMLAKRQQEKQLLSSDISHYQTEITALELAVTAAQSDLEKLKTDLSRLYQAIQQYHQQLISSGS
ncbi:MAG: hypothetical protein KF752_11365 [Pirellulaceae bacterium]|nr:hypothetical protein [Pirellulaceae bacterium]